MSINPENVDLVTVNNLETIELELSRFFAHCGSDGKLGKSKISDLAVFVAPYIASAGGSQFIEVSSFVLPDPEIESGFSFVGKGTYSQTGDPDLVLNGDINLISWNSATWEMLQEIDIDLSDYAKTEDINKFNLSFDYSNGYILTNGSINPSSDWQNTGNIYINGASKIISKIPTAPTPGAGFAIAFYDELGAFISGINTAELNETNDIPETAYYVNLSGAKQVGGTAEIEASVIDNSYSKEYIQALSNKTPEYNIETSKAFGYITTLGAVASNDTADYYNTGPIYIYGAESIKVSNLNATTPGVALAIAFYDKNGVFISGVNSGGSIQSASRPSNAHFVNVSGVATADFKVSVVTKTDFSNIRSYRLDSLKQQGYITNSGIIIVDGAEDYSNTGFVFAHKASYIEVNNLTTTDTSASKAIAFYDINKKFISGINYGLTSFKVIPPTNFYYFVVGGVATTDFNVYIGTGSYFINNDSKEPFLSFVPEKFTLIKGGGETIYLPGLYSQANDGEKNDYVFSDKKIIDKTVVLLDGNTDTGLVTYFKNEAPKISTLEFINKSSFSYSAGARSVICLGDSLTNFNVWHQEFCRQLNGGGNASGSTSGILAPMALPITVIGTRGPSPVKHEGRPSWSVDTYLTQSTAFGSTNSFWNPGTSLFDIDYYLTQNSFYTSLGGTVNSTGSNLDIIIFLGWNDGGIKISELTTLINLIKAKLANVNIILLGMQNIPFDVYNTKVDIYKQTMNTIIQDSIDKKYLSDNLSNVEFFPLSPYFNPIGSYTEVEKKPTIRDASPLKYVNDFIHPALTDTSGTLIGEQTGLGQIADIVTAQYLSYLKTK